MKVKAFYLYTRQCKKQHSQSELESDRELESERERERERLKQMWPLQRWAMT